MELVAHLYLRNLFPYPNSILGNGNIFKPASSVAGQRLSLNTHRSLYSLPVRFKTRHTYINMETKQFKLALTIRSNNLVGTI